MRADKKGIAVWLRKADNDWLNVENNLASSRIPWDTVCFHAQQTIEKMLKALLLRRGIVPPRIHDLSRLVEASPADAEELKPWRTVCRELNDFAVLSRYEGAEPQPAKARDIVERAGQMRAMLTTLLATTSAEKKRNAK